MKIITTITLVLICSIHAIAQQPTMITGISMSLPKGAEKLNKEQLTAFAADKKYDIPFIKLNPKNIYRLDNILLAFYDFKGNYNDDLDQTKTGWDLRYNRNGSNTNYSSILKNINNYHVLIKTDINKNSARYSFYAISKSHKFILNGIVECAKSDSDRAIVLLNQILDNVRFED